jgi:hypothetical protein
MGRKMGLAEYGFEKSCFGVGFVLHITHKEREGWAGGYTRRG